MADPADKDVNITPEPDAPEPAPSTEEPKPSEAAQDLIEEALKDSPEEKPKKESEKPKETEKQKEDPAEDEKKPEKDADPKAEEPEEEKPQPESEKRKSVLNQEIRDLVAQRNQLRSEVEKRNEEVYKPATEDELVEEGMDPTEAKVEAMRQQMELRDYNEKVAEVQLTINNESMQVLQDFPIFRKFELGTESIDKDGNVTGTPNKDFDAELAGEAATLMEANLIRDPNTQEVIGSNVSPYQLYKTLARAAGISTVKGQIKGREDTEAMLANADEPASSAPAKEVEDPILAILSSDDY